MLTQNEWNNKRTIWGAYDLNFILSQWQGLHTIMRNRMRYKKKNAEKNNGHSVARYNDILFCCSEVWSFAAACPTCMVWTEHCRVQWGDNFLRLCHAIAAVNIDDYSEGTESSVFYWMHTFIIVTIQIYWNNFSIWIVIVTMFEWMWGILYVATIDAICNAMHALITHLCVACTAICFLQCAVVCGHLAFRIHRHTLAILKPIK